MDLKDPGEYGENEMNTNEFTIRLEKEQDHRAVENLVRESFWNVYRQADRDTVRAAAGRKNHGTGACGTV